MLNAPTKKVRMKNASVRLTTKAGARRTDLSDLRPAWFKPDKAVDVDEKLEGEEEFTEITKEQVKEFATTGEKFLGELKDNIGDPHRPGRGAQADGVYKQKLLT